ncbi:MAG: SLBB domain-containing protein, partial [Balneolales bacterium]
PFVRDGDIITISRRQEEAPRISISGAVNTPMEIEFKQDDTVARMLRLAGGRIANAAEDSLIIHRRTPTGTELLSLTGGQASADGFELQPNDRIIVPFTHEPGSSYSAWVYGESVSPGNFSITEGETTALDLLEKSGGLNRQAMPHGGYLIRNKPAGRHMPQINTLDAARIQRTSDQVSQGFEYLELEDRLNQNQIFLDLENQDLLAGIMILDGDELYVPRDDRTVFIFGQVNKPGYYPFGENLSAESYIARAGGLALAAEPDRIFIIKAGTKSWYEPGETRLQSGDMIFVDRTPYEELNAKRAYENQRQGIINSRISLVLSAISTTFLVYSIIR